MPEFITHAEFTAVIETNKKKHELRANTLDGLVKLMRAECPISATLIPEDERPAGYP